MPTDTQVNDLKINVLSEAQYSQIQSPSTTELYLVPEVVDTTPTQGSTNTVTSGGVYTALQNIPAQEQADWDETDTSDPSYIQNKPTQLSDFTNDTGFITEEDLADPSEVTAAALNDLDKRVSAVTELVHGGDYIEVQSLNVTREANFPNGSITDSDLAERYLKVSDIATTYTTAYCGTAGETQAKVASCYNFILRNPSYIIISMRYSNVYNGKITLNINGTGAKDIWINGAVSSSSNKNLSGGMYIAYYDGSKYLFRTDSKLPIGGGAFGGSYNDLENKPSSSSFLPSVTSSDNGKILMVSNGAWTAQTVPVSDNVLY